MSSFVNIVDGIVEVRCELNKFSYAEIPHVLQQALHAAQVVVNLVAFARGEGIGVFLDGLVDPDGQVRPLIFRDFNLATLCTAYTLQDSMDDFLTIIMGNGLLAAALNDLIQAAATPGIAPVNCGRVVDAIRNLFSKPDDKGRPASWARMREALRISDSYVRLITDDSIQHRHGERIKIDGDVTVELMRRTWEVMNRYLVFLKLGELPADLFPVLG